MIDAFKQVFVLKKYLLIGTITAFLVFALAVWLPNFRLIVGVMTSSVADFSDRWGILAGLFGSISTNFTIISATYTIMIAVLFGINLAMLIYYMSRNRENAGSGGITAGVGGLVSGFFGIGCAACGTIVLGPLLALIGVGGVVALLPFGGQEFGFLGVGLLGFSVFLIAKKISAPAICRVDE